MKEPYPVLPLGFVHRASAALAVVALSLNVGCSANIQVSESATTSATPLNKCGLVSQDSNFKDSLEASLTDYLQENLIDEKQAPGVVVVAGCDDHTLASLALGRLAYGKSEKPSVERTKYDISSVTKVFTALGIFKLDEAEILDVEQPVGRDLPAYAASPKNYITYLDLLQHKAGIQDGKYKEIRNGSDTPDVIQKNLVNWPVRATQKGTYEYSNIGFSVAGIAASNAVGKPLTKVVKQQIFEPLGMDNSTYQPEVGCAPTTSDYDKTMHYSCTLQDALGRPMQGDTYHTGVFTTGQDLARLMSEIALAKDGKSKVISKKAYDLLSTPTSDSYNTGARNNLSRDAKDKTAMFGEKMSSKAFGHTGWNGTMFSFDPETGVWVGFLSNGTYSKFMEDRYTDFSAIRTGVNDLVAASFENTHQ